MTEANQFLALEEEIVKMLRTVYDPEIPVNVYDLGLVYEINVDEETKHATVLMTFTSPNCPMSDFILEDAKMKVESIKGISGATINITFEPEWTKEMMSEEALLELGFL